MDNVVLAYTNLSQIYIRRDSGKSDINLIINYKKKVNTGKIVHLSWNQRTKNILYSTVILRESLDLNLKNKKKNYIRTLLRNRQIHLFSVRPSYGKSKITIPKFKSLMPQNVAFSLEASNSCYQMTVC